MNNKNKLDQPNVILVITDDQGYGDLGCTGNPWIKTPNIDEFYEKADRLTDFHVSPLCAPTRGALMTGHNPLRNGAWATCWGRSILRREEVTMADVFTDNGYKTGMFGKWHLGDNYPYRPQDRGFQRVVAHKGGGVGQTPDFWGNNYFDDTYFKNGEPVDYEGYCTDVWFEQALDFIEENREQPFFCYLATNAPHAPYLVADEYKELYRDNEQIPEPAFYGMITNIDENFGKLEQKLTELDLKDNTILIFMTDNGSSGGCNLDEDSFVNQGFNADMRGKKGSYYEGGHRVPFFIRWPRGNIGRSQDIDLLSTHMDVVPTLIDLCDLEYSRDLEFDGISLAGVLNTGNVADNIRVDRNKAEGENAQNSDDREKDERTVFVQYRQDTNPPQKWDNAVMTPRWRLIGGRELYDIQADPEQKHDVAEEYPQIASRLQQAHEQWWEKIYDRLQEYSPIVLGNDVENPTCLNAMDVMGDVAWNQGHIVKAQRSTGKWTVEVERAGKYRFSLRRWPEELDLQLSDKIPEEELDEIAPYQPVTTCNKIEPVSANLKVGSHDVTKEIDKNEKEVTFYLDLEPGISELEAWFINDKGKVRGAYYVYVERLD